VKKFLAASTLVFILMLAFFSYIFVNKITAQSDIYFVKANNEEIYIAKDKKWQKLDIVGVNLNSVKPGNFPNEKKVTEQEYLDLLNLVYDMGVNCVKVPDLMEPDFYSALDKFNKDKKNPIYIVQGIYFDEVDLKNGKDIQIKDLEEKYKNNIKTIVDSIHGNPLTVDKVAEKDYYITNISKYLIGYTLGIEFASNDLIYTELINKKESYNGAYFYTNKNASSFESYMAKIADYLVKYEYKEYNEQKLIGFVGSPNNNEKLSEINKNKENSISDYVNPNNIKTKHRLKTGIFASYNLYPSYTNMKEYKNDIQGYLNELKSIHKIPIIIGEYGVPSSRNSGDFNTDINKGESIRVFPISNWTEKDIWQYIEREKIEIVPLYYAKERPVVERDGNIIMVDDERMKLREGEKVQMKKVRFRTLGCYPLTGGIESEATTLDEIVKETLGAVSSERTSRVIDSDGGNASMEKRKREGYF